MDKFATLEPVRLYATAATSSGARFLGKGAAKVSPTQHLIGCLPADLHIVVLTCLAIPDVPAYSRTSRVLSELARDERVWEAKWKSLGVDQQRLGDVLDGLEAKGRLVPPSKAVDIVDDDFGDFASGSGGASVPQDLFSPIQSLSLSSHPAALHGSSKPSYRLRFIRAHTVLKPLLASLSSPPHLILSTIFSSPSPPLLQQSRTLHLLALYLSSAVRPVRNHETLYASLRSAIDRFQANLLSAFDVADGKKDEEGMRRAASASWEVWEGHFSPRDIHVTEWEMGRVWAEKREIFYEQGTWKPLDNFTCVCPLCLAEVMIMRDDRKDGVLDFDAMDEFMEHVLNSLHSDGAIAVRVFPPSSYVVLSFADRIASEVVRTRPCLNSPKLMKLFRWANISPLY